jgi:hypothetical protein
MKRKKPSKPYWKMTTQELAEATKEFDKPIPLSKTRPLSKEERARWERASKAPSRSVFVFEGAGADSEMLLMNVSRELLERVDAYAREHRLSRKEIVERSLRSALAFVE